MEMESLVKEIEECWKNRDRGSALFNNKRGQVGVIKGERVKAVYRSGLCSQDPCYQSKLFNKVSDLEAELCF